LGDPTIAAVFDHANSRDEFTFLKQQTQILQNQSQPQPQDSNSNPSQPENPNLNHNPASSNLGQIPPRLQIEMSDQIQISKDPNIVEQNTVNHLVNGVHNEPLSNVQTLQEVPSMNNNFSIHVCDGLKGMSKEESDYWKEYEDSGWE